MEKPVIISIRGVQSLEPGEEDVMELVTQGVLRQEEGEGFSLSYLESELTGLEGTTTTFRIAPDRITLRREGTLNSEMIFQEGQKHVSLYETLWGPDAGGEHPPGQGGPGNGGGAPLHSLCPGSGQPAHWGELL